MLNIGLWGRILEDRDTFVAQNCRLENVLSSLGGRKVLYSHTYYTEPEFWKLYNKDSYQDLRRQYMATPLPTVYDKVKVSSSQATDLGWWPSFLEPIKTMWPLPGLLGICAAIWSKDYLLHRNPVWRKFGKRESIKHGGHASKGERSE